MTNDEIDKLEAGSELDKLIAEKVMGWRVVDDRGSYHAYDGETWLGILADYFPFSTDIRAAWEVVERIGLSVLKINDGWQARRYVGAYDICSSNDVTAPMAICRAALKSKIGV